MDYVAVLDVSSIVWDPNDFHANTPVYFDLREDIIKFIEKVESKRPPILLRSELLNLMIQGFPWEHMPTTFSPFKNVVFGFLGRIGSEVIQYNSDDTISITADPQVIKPHFSDGVISEMKYLLNEIHNNNDRNNVYFTFKYLWDDNKSLKTTEQKTGEKVYQTIISNDGESVEDFFTGLGKIFCHNPKHHEGRKQGQYESPLTCLKSTDKTLPQKYLDDSIQVGRKHFGWDLKNKVFIVFFRTVGNEYHGHDEIDKNKIPRIVREEFDKRNNGGI